MIEPSLEEMLPHDAQIVWENDAWQIFFSAATRCFYFYVGDYHAIPLALGANELVGLLKAFENVQCTIDNVQLMTKPEVEAEVAAESTSESETEPEPEAETKFRPQPKPKPKPKSGRFQRKK